MSTPDRAPLMDARSTWRAAYAAARRNTLFREARSARTLKAEIAAHVARVPQVLAWTSAEKLFTESRAAGWGFTQAAAARAIEDLAGRSHDHDSKRTWTGHPLACHRQAAKLIACAGDSRRQGARALARAAVEAAREVRQRAHA